MQSHSLTEAVKFAQAESEWSAADTIFVDDDAAACECALLVSLYTLQMVEEEEEVEVEGDVDVPPCFPPKPFVHMRPIATLFVL